jgi:hypothetical protein
VKKIPSVFIRDWKGNPDLVTREVNPEAAWVIAGEGRATIKLDGTACMVRDGKLYARYDCKKGKTPPPNFEPCQSADVETGHWPGWVPVSGQPQYKWHENAWLSLVDPLADGTYELCGAHFQTNPEHVPDGEDRFYPHGMFFEGHADPVRTFAGMRDFLEERFVVEGIVFWHSDGRMAKIKRRDFGLPWPV